LLYILSICLIAFSLNVSVAYSYSVTLSWDAPTTNADGTSLKDLAGYKIYYGTSSKNYSQKINVGNVTTDKISNLTSGNTYYFAVTAYDESGNESKLSNEVSILKCTLTVNKEGTGTGTVTSSAAGINCGSDCSQVYKAGNVVTLIATPDSGSTFAGWDGGGCSGTGTCSFTINAMATVTANFAAESSPIIKILDNRNSSAAITGTWQVSAGSDPYGEDSVYSTDGATFTWYFTPGKSGFYRVSLWWTQRESRSTNVPVEIEHSDGTAKVFVNQQKNGGQWNFIGKYHFKKGSRYAVKIKARPYPATTCADAIKFRLVQ